MKFVVQPNIAYNARKLLQQQNTNNITFLLSLSIFIATSCNKKKRKKQVNKWLS
jgi:hypothetical protein